MEEPGDKNRKVGPRQVRMDNVRPLVFHETDQGPEKAKRITTVGFEVDDSKAFRLEIGAQGPAPFDVFLQTRHDELDALPLEMAAQSQEMQFRSAGGEGVDQMKDFHLCPLQLKSEIAV
jgi:hypothetical protein